MLNPYPFHDLTFALSKLAQAVCSFDTGLALGTLDKYDIADIEASLGFAEHSLEMVADTLKGNG